MDKKIGRNDLCPCGSGKKYKNCCMQKSISSSRTPKKLTAKWLNAPEGPNLMERTFGKNIEATGKIFAPAPKKETSEVSETNDPS